MKRLYLAAPVAGLLVAIVALPTYASELTGGCILQATSRTAAGEILDSAAAPGPSASQSDPLEVDYFGQVDIAFHTPVAFENSHWTNFVYNIPFQAERDSEPREQDRTDVVTIDDASPINARVVGVFYMSGDIWGNDDSVHCTGSGWVRLTGDPVGTPLWATTVILLALGFLGLVITPYAGGTRRHWLRGVLSGLLFGLGLGMGAIVYGFTTLGPWTPWILVALGTILGVLLALLPRPWGGSTPLRLARA